MKFLLENHVYTAYTPQLQAGGIYETLLLVGSIQAML